MRVDWDNPISDDRLNGGLLVRLQAGEDNPYWGGPKLLDLCNFSDGTLANAPKWSGALGRSGGFGSLYSGGSGESVSVTLAPSPTDWLFSFSFWIRSDSTSGLRCAMRSGGGSGNIFLYNNSGTWTDLTNTFGSVVVGQWEHFCYAQNGFGIAAEHWWYKNGVEVGYRSTHQAGTSDTFEFMADDFAQNHVGAIDDIRFYSRLVPPGEVYDIYATSRQQYDPTLNWIKPRKYFFVDAGGGGTPAFNYLTLLGVG